MASNTLQSVIDRQAGASVPDEAISICPGRPRRRLLEAPTVDPGTVGYGGAMIRFLKISSTTVVTHLLIICTSLPVAHTWASGPQHRPGILTLPTSCADPTPAMVALEHSSY